MLVKARDIMEWHKSQQSNNDNDNTYNDDNVIRENVWFGFSSGGSF